MHDELLEFVTTDLARGAGCVIDAKTSLFAARVLDSMCLMELVTFVEERYGIKVRPVDLIFENFDSVDNMARYVERKRAPRPAAGTRAAEA
jgi:acyl carrier protein